ncbi:MAG: phage tail protein [Gemmatimonadota bacterium]|nr:phage tail protein [Gemmatimonadota bacterium]
MTLPNEPPRPEPPHSDPRGRTPLPWRGGDDAVTVAAHFTVEIAGIPISCTRVSGLELASQVDELSRKEDPGDPERVLWSAPACPGRLLLTRALDGDRTLYEWRREALSGKPAIRQVVIGHLESAGGRTLYTWKITSAWPLRWAGPRYDALHGDIALEELELVFDDLIRQEG